MALAQLPALCHDLGLPATVRPPRPRPRLATSRAPSHAGQECAAAARLVPSTFMSGLDAPVVLASSFFSWWIMHAPTDITPHGRISVITRARALRKMLDADERCAGLHMPAAACAHTWPQAERPARRRGATHPYASAVRPQQASSGA